MTFRRNRAMKSRTAVDGVDYEDEEALGPLLPGTNHTIN